MQKQRQDIRTTSQGCPIGEIQNSQSAGPRGPLLLQDVQLIDKLAKFNREVIPQSVIHAKGSGAHGYFELTHDVSKYTKAQFLQGVGKKTPIFARFSTMVGELGSADTVRDIRGFSLKFYTEEGNYDLVGHNTPVFSISDPIKFPDFIHCQKMRCPRSHLKDPSMAWDFLSQTPESLLQLMILYSDRGIPDGYRHMHGYGSHTYKWVNESGEVFFVKFHLKTNQGIKNLTVEKARELAGLNPDYAMEDLFQAIEKEDYPSWTWFVQIIPEKEGEQYKCDIFDVTKIISHKDYPLIEIGKIVLNKNPDNYIAETEQVAFSPSNLVPGIEPSNDKMLQGRIFSYPDANRFRLGGNYECLPINCPVGIKLTEGELGKKGAPILKGTEYEPGSAEAPISEKKIQWAKEKLQGETGRFPLDCKVDNYVQPRELILNIFTREERERLIMNIVTDLQKCNKEIQIKMIEHFKKIDTDYGKRVAKELGIKM